jgi:hypothetical protein
MQRPKPRTRKEPVPIAPGPILARALSAQAAPGIGFSTATAPIRPPSVSPFVTYAGAGHLAAFGPTRGSKGVGIVITNALNFPGTLIVFDPRG